MTVTIDLVTLFTLIVGGLFVLLAFGAVIMFAKKVRRFIAARKFDSYDREAMHSRWEEIERMLDDHGEMQLKIAIFEADKLLDHALRSLSFPGNTLGERLRFAAYKYPKIRHVWWAHKVRNQLAHESSYHLDRAVARKAIRSFRRALEILGAV